MSSPGAKALYKMLGSLGQSEILYGNHTFVGQMFVKSNTLKLGPIEYPTTYSMFTNSAYLTLDKVTEEDDASIVMRQGGLVVWEAGACTELPGAESSYHIKRVTGGPAGSEIFTDVFMIDHATGHTWIPKPFKLGIGNLPLELLHVSDNPSAARVIAKIENYNAGVGTSRSAVWQFQGGSVSWVLGNDYGLNAGNNFFLQSSTAGLKFFVDVNGVVLGGGSTTAATEALRVESTTQGILPPRMTAVQRDAMGTKNTSLLIWNSDKARLQAWNASLVGWQTILTRGRSEDFIANQKQDIVWWGDSLTSGAGGVSPTTAFDELYSTASAVNKGVGGETSTQIKTRFLAATPAALYGIQIIWAGRNNYGSPTTVKADIAAMIAAMSHSRFLVLGIINEDVALEQNTGGNYSIITTLNNDLAALYGDKFVDIRRILIDDGLAMAGITATAADTTDIGLDVPPESLRSDTLHLNTAGYAVVAKIVRNRLQHALNDAGYVKTTGAQTVGGAKTYTGLAEFQAGLKITTGGAFAQGAFYKDANLGLVQCAITGAVFDYNLVSVAGLTAIGIVAGGKNLMMPGFSSMGTALYAPDRPLVVWSTNNALAAGSGSVMVIGQDNKERFEARSCNAGSGGFMGKSAGGADITAPTATPAETSVALFGGGGHDGTGWVAGLRSALRFNASQLWTTIAQGVRATITTTPNGSTTQVDRFEIRAGGMARFISTVDIIQDIPASGKGVEIYYRADGAHDQGQILAFDRGAAAYKNLRFDGLALQFFSSGGQRAVIDASGLDVTSGDIMQSGMRVEKTVRLAADVTNNNATANTIADVTGLSFPVVNGGTYQFKFFIVYTAAATTTGSRWAINGPTNSLLAYRSEYSLSATGRTVNEARTAYDSPAACNTDSAATAGNIAVIEGVITATAAGNVIARFASEVASSAIVAKVGSYVEFQRIN